MSLLSAKMEGASVMATLQQSFKNVMDWIDDRLPVTEAYEKHLSKYYAPKNLNIWYYSRHLLFCRVGQPIVDWHLVDNELRPHRERSIRLD